MLELIGMLLALIGAADPVTAQASSQVPMSVDIDATQVARRLIHAHVRIPVTGTRMTVSYPRWNPGDHAPFQHVGQLADLEFRAADSALTWRRDLADADVFHVEVPAGAKTLEADFEFVLPAPGDPLADASQHLLILRWNLYLLYIAGPGSREMPVVASVRLPQAWEFATALPVAAMAGDTVRFQQASLETLIDSPLLCGRMLRRFSLPSADGIAHELDVAAEKAADLPTEQQVLQTYGTLVGETVRLFGAGHYRSYHFLVAVSDFVSPGAGFEHLESSDTRLPGGFFHDPGLLLSAGDIIPHEFAHSWNGKYRRPADLYPIDYQAPEKTDLLWVYESLTDYVGVILASRIGDRSQVDAREYWAAVAAKVEHETGRTWRNMQDTADSVPLTMIELFLSPPGWNSWLRVLDYYDEGALIWLEVNSIIVEQTQGQGSLDDFLRAFYGASDGDLRVRTYDEQDVFEALGAIAPYDWSAFFHARLTSHAAQAPLGGLERSGWRLVYDAQPNSFLQAARRNGLGSTLYSAGIAVGTDGTIGDVLRGGPGDAAGLVPGMKITRVNGKAWTPLRLVAAIAASPRQTDPIRVQTEIAGVTEEFLLPYHGGLRYPHLQRMSDHPDLLTPLFEPHR
jgi:predicted metalloprotease with PDZ domain